MTSRIRSAAALVATAGLAATGLALTAPTAAAAPDPDRVPGAWIVTLVDDASPDAVAADHGRRHAAQVDRLYRHALKGYAARMSETAAAKVARDSRVLSVEPDRVVSIAAKPGGGGSTTQPAQTVPTGITRIGAPTATTAAAIDVAVIDTGIDIDHPDLGDVSQGVNCIGRGSNGEDGNGHGTHVAGTIGALDNGIGVVGVAPGVRLHPVRVLDNRGSGTTSSILCGIEWVTSHKDIEVANMSLGGGGSEPTGTGCSTGQAYHDAVCRSVAAGTTYVVAAGNSAADAKGFLPAAFDEVITVSALADFDGESGGLAGSTCRADVDDTFADFSNYGEDVDLIAPGVCIKSTWLNGGYNTISGTSMASPHVAGAAALAKANNPLATPAQVQTALQAAGTTDWSNADGKDGIQERLVNVRGY